MGRMLGAYADDQEQDHPDLNKCPDCSCFFAGDTCPLCKKVCPEHMRAGHRPAVKQKRRRRSGGSGRVTFVSWYHSWWFIALMLLFFPIGGIVLLITSPHKRWQKGLFIAIAAVYMLVSTVGLGNILSGISDLWDPPVDTSLSKEEYVARCETVTAEQLYRSPDEYRDAFLCVRLKVTQEVTYIDKYGNVKEYICYLCEADDGSEYKILLRDCLLGDPQRFIPGDIITVYGEGAGEGQAYDAEYRDLKAPCLNMAYAVLENQ